MSEITVGSVGVEVVPDARKFGRTLSAEVNPEAARIGREFGQLFGEAAQREMARGVRDGLDTGTRSSTEQGTRQGSQFGGSFARSVKARIETALRSLPDVKLRADSTDVDRELVSIRRNLEVLRDKRIGIDVDAGEATAQLQAFQERLERLSKDSATVDVRVDAAAAGAELAKFQAEVNRLDGQNPTIRPDVDTAAASAQLALLRGEAAGAGGSFSALAAAALLLGPALIPIGAAGAAAMAAVASGALAAAAGVGVLLLALGPIIGAVQALRQAHTQAGTAARGSTNAHLQMASAMDAVTTAQRGLKSAVEDARVAQVRSAEAVKSAERDLAEAERDAAADQVDSARKVSDAKRRLSDVARQASSDLTAANRRVVQAEQSVADAQKDALRAQQDLNDARKEAAEAAEDLANQVVDGQLDERNAVLAVQQAQQDLQKTQQDHTATDLQRQQAQLTYDEAVQRLKEQQLQNQRLADEKARSDAAGIDGSKQVQSAQDALLEAQKRLADAQQDSADAAAADAEAQRKSAEDIADAQRSVADAVRDSVTRQQKDLEAVAEAHRKVADAVRDSADQQRRSAGAIASAQQAVVSAQRGVQQASQSAGAAGSSALESARSKLAALTPAGQSFVGFINSQLIPAFHGISGAAQTGFLPGLQEGLKSVLPLVPSLTRFVGDLGKTMGTLATEAGKALTSPFWRQFFDYVGKTAGPILLQMGRTFGNVFTGIAGLLEAFDPVTKQFGDGILGLSRRFADFGKSAGKNEGFQNFIQYLITNGPLVVSTFGAIFGAIGHIVSALAPLGPVVLLAVEGFSHLISAVPPEVIIGIASAIGTVVGVTKAWAIAQAILDAALTANPIFLVIGLLVGLGVALYEAYKHSETFRNIVNEVWQEVSVGATAMWHAISAVLGALKVGFEETKERIVSGWTTLGHFFTDTIPDAFRRFRGFVSGIVGALHNDLDLTRQQIVNGWNTLSDFFTQTLPGAFRRGVDAISRAWDGLKDAAKDPVRFVVDTVINHGIIDTFNRIAGWFNVKPIDHVQLPKGFATGGFVSGPGGPRDDLVPAMLSNGEFVIPADVVSRVGVDFFEYLRHGGSFGGDPGGIGKFANGGLIEDTKRWIPSVDKLPYVWGAVGPEAYDCSGLAGTIYGKVSGLSAPGVRYFTTSSDLRQFGFAPGVGTLTLGLNPGEHVVGNLAGEGFEARSTATGIFTGSAATSPGAMAQQWFLTSMPGGSSVPSGISIAHPIESVKSLFSGVLGGLDSIEGTAFGHLVGAVPRHIVSDAVSFIGDHVPHIPGFADGGLVTKYDDGGYLPPGLTTVLNATGKPEPVFTAAQFASLRQGGAGSRGDVNVSIGEINYPAPETVSESVSRTARKLAAFGLAG